MKPKKPKVPEGVPLFTGYQHISNGGITFDLTHETCGKNMYHKIEVSMSSFGLKLQTTIPVFMTTPTILRALADEIERQSVTDPKYLRPIAATIRSDFLGGTVYYRSGPNGVEEVAVDELFCDADSVGEKDGSKDR